MEKFSDQMCPPKPTSHSWKWAHAEGGKVHKIWPILHLLGGFPGGSDGKESACQCRRHGFDLWVGKIPWRRAWQPTPVFLPREPHGQRSPEGTVHGVAKSWMQLSN